MKSKSLLIATIIMLTAFSSRSIAKENAPVLRENGAWVMISGTANPGRGYPKGTLPWTYAIRKSAVMSVCIQTDYEALHQAFGNELNYTNATPEEIQALPAVISITTTELAVQGASASVYKTYEIKGLTHASAPAMLEKILQAIKISTESKGEK
ncbi:MAG: hypothetical protein WCK77_25825 [Verrucomicrobiota bacterium]